MFGSIRTASAIRAAVVSIAPSPRLSSPFSWVKPGSSSLTGGCRHCRLFGMDAAAGGDHKAPKVHAEVYGTLDGHEGQRLAPVFIAHGMMGSAANFQSIAKALNKATGRQIVAYDARNHGNSFHSDGMSYQAMSEDLCNLILMLCCLVVTNSSRLTPTHQTSFSLRRCLLVSSSLSPLSLRVRLYGG